MTSWDLPKLWTELTKIGHIFRKQSTLKNKVFKKIINKVGLLVSNSSQKKMERFDQFLMQKKDFKGQNFAIFDKVVHKSDDDMI